MVGENMKQMILLESGWKLKDAEKKYPVLDIPQMPMQVHDILFSHGIIGDEYQNGNTTHCHWVSEQKWTYQTTFECPPWEKNIRIRFEGLDTLAEIFLNGVSIGKHSDSYLPTQYDVKDILRSGLKNELEVVFYSVTELLEQLNKEMFQTKTPTSPEACRYIRKSFHDFTGYLGAKPDFLKVGIFDEVVLELIDDAELIDFNVDYSLNDTLNRADVCVSVLSAGDIQGKRLILTVSLADETELECNCISDEDLDFSVQYPKLWWPRGYGRQDLYCFSLRLFSEDGKLLDQKSKQIGFRKIEMVECLDFTINKRPIKLWGGNLTPVDGRTTCENPNRVREIVQLAFDCNMNMLRVWGEGNRFKDLLYELADQMGILLWQEFFCGHAQYPLEKSVWKLILKETEYQIKNLRHHPSILLWCGGNECFMSRDFAKPGEEYGAAQLFEHDMKNLCALLDPQRYYHVNSPFGGPYTNSPDFGDTHSYTNSWYVPGGEIPKFVSENLRVSLPPVRSLKRYLKTNELPSPAPLTHGSLPWPEEFEEVTSAESFKKIPPIEQFYDAVTPEQMVYRFGAAAGSYLKESVERYRRGKLISAPFAHRGCKGHLLWKLNTTLPHIYSSIIDYYLEPGIPYYFLKRAYEPLLISIEVADHINIWIINDTAKEVQGTLIADLFDMRENKVSRSLIRPFFAGAGESVPVTTLDEFGQFTRDKLLRASLEDRNGTVIAATNNFADIERHLVFPDARLSVSCEDNLLTICTDRFARCVEILGNDDGDEFGWRFDDNYFDLFPGEVKQIRISGHHSKGIITAKAAYSPYVSQAEFQRE